MNSPPAIATSITAVDFETTGAVPGYVNEPWEIGLVTLRDGAIDRDSAFGSLLRVGPRPFNPRAPGRHALVRGELATAPRLADLWPRLSPRLTGTPLAAHNIPTEKAVLRRAAPMHRFGPWIDTLTLARAAYPDLPSHALEDVLATLGLLSEVQALSPGGAPHMALFDAIGSAVLLAHLLRQPAWRGLSVDALARAHPRRYYQGKTKS